MSSSVKSCCIKGCTDMSRRKNHVDLPVKFYCFPLSSCGASWKNEKRIKWMNAVRNYVKNPKDWQPNKNTRICSAHFVNNKKSEHPLHPSYIPTIFPGDVINKKLTQSLQRFERSQVRQSKKSINNREEMVNDNNTSAIVVEQDTGEIEAHESSNIDMNILSSPQPVYRSISCQTENVQDNMTNNFTYFFCNLDNRDGLSTAAVQVNIAVKKTVDKMCEASMSFSKKTVQDSSCDPIDNNFVIARCQGFHGLSSISTDEAMSSLTGVTFAIFSFLLNALPDCKTFKVDKRAKLLITLMKLKTGLTFTAISVLFNIHRTTVHRIFIKNLQLLNILLRNFIFWPSKATVQATLPEAFKKYYPETRVIIDCTEVHTELPPEVKQKVLMYSDYKHHHTIKFLVGCAPNGFISFLSKCYGGRAGDCFITNDCGIVDLIEPGDVVLADKGFPQIQTEVEKKNAVFVMPPFCHNDQFTPEEVNETYNIASVRIHIERVNQRIKDFYILSKVPVSLFPHIDEIVFVICALINVEKPLFKRNESKD